MQQNVTTIPWSWTVPIVTGWYWRKPTKVESRIETCWSYIPARIYFDPCTRHLMYSDSLRGVQRLYPDAIHGWAGPLPVPVVEEWMGKTQADCDKQM